jgi:hypothetical protein
MPVTVYKSTDAGAPVLSGAVGTLVTVLDAVLVNGYGAKAAAGWTKAFTGANKAAYQMSGLSAADTLLRVQDDAPNPTLANAREARIRGFETMTTVDAGLGLFPTAVQFPNGLILRKSATNDATARPWIVVADGRTMYMFVKSGDYGAGYASFCFGEIYSLKPTADGFNSIIIGKTIEQIAASPVPTPANEPLDQLSGLAAVALGHYMPRTFSEFPQSGVNVGKHGNAAHSSSLLTGLAAYPNPVDAGIYLSQVWVHEPIASLGVVRGRMRGFWHFLHPAGASVNDGDTFAGSGPTAGKTFLIIKPDADGVGVFCMETSDTWETN